MYHANIYILCCFAISTIDHVNGKSTPSSSSSSRSPSPSPRYYYTPHYIYGSGSGSDDGPVFLDPALPAATQTDIDNAAKIVDSKFDEKVIASILPFQPLDRRQVINNEVANLHKKKPLIHQKYLPNHKKNAPFKDLCFSLVNYPITVLAMYLGEFLHRKDETFIIMVLTLCQQMQQLTYIYNRKHKNSLKKRRRKQRHPFANLMKVWVARDRDPEDSKYTDADIDKDVESMKKEYPHWHESRDSLENTLIYKCMNFSYQVIERFEAQVNVSIEAGIADKVHNHDLVDAYTSLALYVKNRYHYMAKTMLEHCDGKDRWAIWIMYVGFIDPSDWPKIDVEFKKINNNVSLKDHILNNAEPDKILLEVMAVMIDPKYKPTYL